MIFTIDACEDYEDLSRNAARRVLNALTRKPDSLLCAAGGSTPLRAYDFLAQYYVRNPKKFQKLRLVKLDEWGGIPMKDPGTCEQQMQSRLVGPLGIAKKRYFGFHSHPRDPEVECRRIRGRLAAEGPIDFCLLGLGMNGHIAMNEPAASLQPLSHCARLSGTTLKHPMLSKSRSRPTYGLSLGMAEILSSREIVLLVSGAKKGEVLRKLLRREITTQFPSSFLWLHPNWALLCDRDAAKGLKLKPESH